MDWTMFLAIFTAITSVIALQTVLLLWIISKLDSDIKAATADSNAKWMAANERIDTMGARIDQTQAIIMRMVENINKKDK